MKGMIFVDPEGLHGDALRRWVDAGVGYARGLPPSTPASASDVTESTRAAKMAVTAVRQPGAQPRQAGRFPAGTQPVTRLTAWTVWYSPRLAWAHAG